MIQEMEQKDELRRNTKSFFKKMKNITRYNEKKIGGIMMKAIENGKIVSGKELQTKIS